LISIVLLTNVCPCTQTVWLLWFCYHKSLHGVVITERRYISYYIPHILVHPNIELSTLNSPLHLTAFISPTHIIPSPTKSTLLKSTPPCNSIPCSTTNTNQGVFEPTKTQFHYSTHPPTRMKYSQLVSILCWSHSQLNTAAHNTSGYSQIT
jgi:hypothetical protein